MIAIQEMGVYTFTEQKRQVNTLGWLLVNLGTLQRLSAQLPSGRQLFSFTDNRQFALLLPAGGCFDFVYDAGREDWVIEMPVATISEAGGDQVRLLMPGLEAEVPAFIPLHAAQAELARSCLTRMLEAFHSPERRARLSLHLAFHALLDCLLNPGVPLELEDPAEALRKRIIADRGFVCDLATLSRQCGYSPDHLRRLFEARFGISPKSFRTDYRMRLAQDLLRLRDLSVQEVASQLGYGHAAHFSAAFSQHAGLAPNIWKKRQTTE